MKDSLAITHPDIAAQWHPTKNGNLTPKDVVAGSAKKVWWVCDKGHAWCSEIRKRTGEHKTGCPICSNRKVLIGFNDLATTHPEIAKEWHPTKNGNLTPRDVVGGSAKQVWWKCEKGHTWKAQIRHRIMNGKSNCPYCSNRKVLVGFNDLATTYPEIAKEWHPTKNGILTPRDVTAGSGKKVWWVLENGYEWECIINSRIKSVKNNKNFVCRVYPNLIVGVNDLATTHPALSNEWHPTKNGKLTPKDVTHGSRKKVWWICEKGHEWESAISDRSGERGRGCPICSNKKVLIGFNDLATTHPEIAKEWHPTKNGNLTPRDVVGGSATQVWWMCEHGHEWRAKIVNRTMLHNGCPVCSNKKVLAGFNDLATTHPEIAKEWHPTKNGKLTPKDVVAGSRKKVWWICEKGHEWVTTISNRVLLHNGCPICAMKYGTSFPEKSIFYYISKMDPFVESVMEKNVQWDVYIKAKNNILGKDVIIEYDGSYWHNNDDGVKNDRRKDTIAKNRGIILYRVKSDISLSKNDFIRDGNVFKYKETNIKLKNNEIFASIINTLTIEIYGKYIDVDTARDAEEIMKLYMFDN